MQGEIARLRELMAKATPGPWAVGQGDPESVLSTQDYYCIAQTNTAFSEYAANAALIAAMHEALPALLALAEAVEAAPAGEVAYIDEDDAGGEVHVYTTKAVVRSCRTDLIDRRVRLVALPDGGEAA